MFFKIYLIIGFVFYLSQALPSFKKLLYECNSIAGILSNILRPILWILFWPFILVLGIGTLYLAYLSSITLLSAGRMKTGNDLEEKYKETKKEMSFRKFVWALWKKRNKI